MATPPKKPEDKLKVGAKPDYRPEFCEMLVAHLKDGGTYESFAAICDVSYATLYNWEKAYPEFLEAKNRGKPKALKFYIDMGKAMATGQIKRLHKRTVRMENGKVVFNPKTGEPIYDEEFVPATPNAAVWIFMMKNMHGWHDQKNFTISGDPNGAPIKYQSISPEEKLKEVVEMQRVIKEIESGVTPAFEPTDK